MVACFSLSSLNFFKSSEESLEKGSLPPGPPLYREPQTEEVPLEVTFSVIWKTCRDVFLPFARQAPALLVLTFFAGTRNRPSPRRVMSNCSSSSQGDLRGSRGRPVLFPADFGGRSRFTLWETFLLLDQTILREMCLRGLQGGGLREGAFPLDWFALMPQSFDIDPFSFSWTP